MGRALASSATLAQSLDQTFPNRLLSQMTAQGPTLSEAALREKLTQLEVHRARLSRVDLIEKSNDSAIFSDAEFDEPTRRILTLYVEDAFKKLSPYDEILVKIELFSELLNDRFQFKSVVIRRSSGFQIIDRRSVVLDPSSLSSGEQHELVLVYDLLFKTKKDTLLLVDEPEISLHIAWQKKFLTDLRRIIELSPMDVVLSTHSPQLIGGNLDLAVRLSGPSE
jgi:predicted ATP-binding protein involved in virulence